jgi:hypothetical protein
VYPFEIQFPLGACNCDLSDEPSCEDYVYFEINMALALHGREAKALGDKKVMVNSLSPGIVDTQSFPKIPVNRVFGHPSRSETAF